MSARDAKDPGGRGARRWVATWNNYQPDSIFQLQSLRLSTIWGICSEEVAPTTGTPHLQIYMVFKNMVKFSTLTSLLPHVWWAPARGDNQQNYLYVTKTRPPRLGDDGSLLRPADIPNEPHKIHEWGTRPNFQGVVEGMIDLMMALEHFDDIMCVVTRDVAWCDDCQNILEQLDAAATLLSIAHAEFNENDDDFPFVFHDNI